MNNRPIRFRAWIREWDRMVNVDVVAFKDGWISHKNLRQDSIADTEPVSQTDPYCVTPLDKCELMQFTGYDDKNRKDVYEGDVVKCTYYRLNDDEESFTLIRDIGIVKFVNGSVMIEFQEELLSWFDVYTADNEVIGNVFEDSHLLGKDPEILGHKEPSKEIGVYWHIDDVQSVIQDRNLGVELTSYQCKEVLNRAKENHDASIGINWDVLEDYVLQVAKEAS